MSVRYVQYGPVTPNKDQLNVFQVSVNTELNDLEIREKARIVGIESSVSAFVDEKGHQRVIYFAQIEYEGGKGRPD